MNKPTHLSISQINKYENCPRCWWLEKIAGEAQVTGSAAKRGNLFDQAVAVELGLMKPLEPDILDTLKPEQIKLGKIADEYSRVSQTELTDSRIFEATEAYKTQGGWTQADEAQKEINLTKNQWGTLKQIYGVDYDLWLPIVGYIDLFRKDPTNPFATELLDLKTSERAEYRSSWSLQCALYCLATGAAKFSIHLVTFTKQIRLHSFSYRPTKQTYAWVMNTVGEASERMRITAQETAAERIPAKPGYWCGWCPRQTTCEAQLAGNLVKEG